MKIKMITVLFWLSLLNNLAATIGRSLGPFGGAFVIDSFSYKSLYLLIILVLIFIGTIFYFFRLNIN